MLRSGRPTGQPCGTLWIASRRSRRWRESRERVPGSGVGRMGTSSGSPPAGPIQQPQKFQYGGKRECTTIQMHGVPSRCGRCIDSRSATGRPGSESYAPSQGLAVATRATEKELNKYPGKKNIVLVYRTIIYVYDIRAVELIECPRKRTQPSLPGGGADPGFGTERGCWSQSEGRVAHVRGPRRWGRLSVMTAANRR